MDKLTIKEGMTELGVTTFDGKKAQVSSRKVADTFDKQHSHVMRDIRDIINKSSDNFGESNYGLSYYKAGTREYKEYLITKDGLVMLVMGYKTKKAMKIKEAYIEQFNKMGELIKNREFARMDYQPMTKAFQEYYLEVKGREPNGFEYANEADRLNLLVLGMKSKEYRQKHNLNKDEVRDFMPKWQLKALDKLQRLNTDLLQARVNEEQRQNILENKYQHIFNELELPKEVDNSA